MSLATVKPAYRPKTLPQLQEARKYLFHFIEGSEDGERRTAARPRDLAAAER